MKYSLPVIFALAATSVAVPTANSENVARGESCGGWRGPGRFDDHDRKGFGGYRGHGNDRHDGKKGLVNVGLDIDLKGHGKKGHGFDGHGFNKHDGKKGLINVDVDINGKNGHRGGNWDGRWDGKNGHRGGNWNGHDGRKGHGLHRGHGKGRRCVFPTFIDENQIVVDVDINVLGINAGIDVDVDIDIGRVRQRYPKCRAVYCCPSRSLWGKRVSSNCNRY